VTPLPRLRHAPRLHSWRGGVSPARLRALLLQDIRHFILRGGTGHLANHVLAFATYHTPPPPPYTSHTHPHTHLHTTAAHLHTSHGLPTARHGPHILNSPNIH